MPRIHFTSGKKLDITEHEYRSVVPKMKNGGVRFYNTPRGDFVPLNSTTIEIITFGEEPAKLDTVIKKPTPKPAPPQESDKFMPKAEPVKEAPAESDEEKAKRVMDDMIAKSNCTHTKEDEIIYKQETAKGVRFFPVCSFCGFRGRYVKAESLTDEQKLEAKVWAD